MTSAAIYARVSSARQKKDETIGSQTAALRAHAAASRFTSPRGRVFEDEGIGSRLGARRWSSCGTWPRRAAWTSICVISPDRLARKFAYQASLLEEFARAGSGEIRQERRARRQPRRRAAGPVPGHVRRDREGPADGSATGAARRTGPDRGR